jgi:hypothetical protein
MLLCASVAIGNADSAPRPTGTYTDMRYHRESGDVLGTEVSVVNSRQGYYAVYQSSEGEPGVPVVVPAKVEGTSLQFDVPAATDSRGRFTGTFDATGLTGTFAGSQERVDLKRSASYWSQSH